MPLWSAMTTEIENRLRRTQRHMLRMIFQRPRRIIKKPQHMVNSAREAQSNTPQSPRSEGTAETGSSHDVDSTASPIPEKPPVDDEEDKVLEPSHIWIRRCTQQAETYTKERNIEEWIKQYRKCKWRWFAQIAQSARGEWIFKVLQWEPASNTNFLACRRVGRPEARLIHELLEFLGTERR